MTPERSLDLDKRRLLWSQALRNEIVLLFNAMDHVWIVIEAWLPGVHERVVIPGLPLGRGLRAFWNPTGAVRLVWPGGETILGVQRERVDGIAAMIAQRHGWKPTRILVAIAAIHRTVAWWRALGNRVEREVLRTLEDSAEAVAGKRLEDLAAARAALEKIGGAR